MHVEKAKEKLVPRETPGSLHTRINPDRGRVDLKKVMGGMKVKAEAG